VEGPSLARGKKRDWSPGKGLGREKKKVFKEEAEGANLTAANATKEKKTEQAEQIQKAGTYRTQTLHSLGGTPTSEVKKSQKTKHPHTTTEQKGT